MDNVFNNYGENTLFFNNIEMLKKNYEKYAVLFADDEKYYKDSCNQIVKEFYCTYELIKKFNVSPNIMSMYVEFENTIIKSIKEGGINNASK